MCLGRGSLDPWDEVREINKSQLATLWQNTLVLDKEHTPDVECYNSEKTLVEETGEAMNPSQKNPKCFCARGKLFTPRQLVVIREMCVRYAAEGRTKISKRICRTLRWRQPNGRLKDMACREALRTLEKSGVVALPPPRTRGAIWKRLPDSVEYGGDQSLITALDLRSLHFVRVTTKREAILWNQLVQKYHYLESSRIVGRQLKYLVMDHDRPIACLGWGDSCWAIKARDAWIGWSSRQRLRNRRLIVTNVRFLILPWVKVKNLASYLLAQSIARLTDDWQSSYGIRPVLLETFVDPTRFSGTCYRAANWLSVGASSGYAKKGSSHHNSRAPKALFVYPINTYARMILKGQVKWNSTTSSRRVHDMKTGLSVFPLVSFSVLK